MELKKRYKTIVIGAGSGGLSCALKLLDGGEDFLVISDTLGGRLCYSEQEKMNYGAYFIMQNYHNASRLVIREDMLNRLDAGFHGPNGSFSLLSLHTVRRAPELLRFLRTMNGFADHYATFKRRCLEMPQSAALAMDKYMYDIFHMSAAEFIHKNRFERVAEEYISKFSYACTGIGMDKLNALDYLNVSMGVMIPIYRFRFDAAGMREKLGDHYLSGRVVSIQSETGRHTVSTEDGKTVECEYLAVATPAGTTQALLPRIGEIRGPCRLYAWHIDGALKERYARYSINLFPLDSEVVVTTRLADGTFLLYTSRKDEALLSQVCRSYRVLGSKDWEEAMYVTGDAYLEQSQGNGVYIVGDHNGLGLEPTAISGIFAAGQIIKNEKRWRRA